MYDYSKDKIKSRINRKIDILADMGFIVLRLQESDHFEIRLESRNFAFIKVISYTEFEKTNVSILVKEFTEKIKQSLVHKQKENNND